MALWKEVTISKAGHKSFVDLHQAYQIRPAAQAEPGASTICFAGGQVSVIETVAELMAMLKEPPR